jgi:hypothetical protein
MNRIAAKSAVKALALGDRILFTLHAKKRRPAGGKFPLTREQEKHEVACVLVVDRNVLVITGYGYGRRSR